MIKKANIVLLVLSCLLFLTPITAQAKTLREVYENLDKLEAEIEENQSNQQQTAEDIANTKAEIKNIEEELVQIDTDVKDSIEKQEELDIEILNKKSELENILQYYQISNGENEYLEYIFGAESVSDFIHRNAVVEEITGYNENLINEMLSAIEEEKVLREELAAKEQEMIDKQATLKSLQAKLYVKQDSLEEEGLSIKEEIDSTREMIDLYKDECDLDEDIAVCSNKLPPDTSFWRPLAKGYITSEWGYRHHPVYGTYSFHGGIDIGVGGNPGDNVYAAATGKVAYIKYRSSCGGNMVYINHNVNGKSFTTVYMHLQSYSVSVGDIVTKNTVIGKVGGDDKSTPWDYCSTGAHLHFGIYNGITTSSSASINPRTYVNFPSKIYTYFYDRITRYN